MAENSKAPKASKAAKAVKSKAPKLSLAHRRKARSLLVQALYQWLLAEAEPLDIIKQFKEEHGRKVDWDYFDELILEIPKQTESLEAHFQPLLDREIKSLDPIERVILYLGTFELERRMDIPYRVVINESVELAKIYGATESHKYINGVLDKLAPKLRPLEQNKK